jgi:putative tryptophan/tyrosine transport system substrate-binding protein
VTNFGGELVVKRLELLRELVPHASVIGFLLNPANSISEGDITRRRQLSWPVSDNYLGR